MSETILLAEHGDYSKPFTKIAAKLWNHLFEDDDFHFDLAHWLIDGYSSTVRLTGRSIDLDEYSPEWRTTDTFIVIIDGFLESMPKGMSQPNESMLSDFKAWTEDGISTAFQSKRIANKFSKRFLPSSSFAIVASPTDAGLADDELKLLWASDGELTPRSIRARQLASRKKKKPSVKKLKRR